MEQLKLVITKNSKPYDCSDLLVSAAWSGKRGQAARTLDVTMLDGPDGSRSGVNPERGDACIFLQGAKELFRGMFMKDSRSGKDETVKATAHDTGYFLANNKDTFVFSDITAGNVFQQVCERFNLPMGGIASTEYAIPSLVRPRVTAWDVIQEALAETYKANGTRFYVLAEGGELKLFERQKEARTLVLEPGVNIEAWERARSTEKLKTRLTMYSKENTVRGTAEDANAERELGIRHDVVGDDAELNEAQVKELLDGELATKKLPVRTLKITARGRVDMITGYCAFISIPAIKTQSVYYIEADKHSFDRDGHEMQLTLSEVME